MLELMEIVGGFFDLLFSWRFWLSFMIALVAAKTISSVSEGNTGSGLPVIIMIVGIFVGWWWNKSRTGSKIP
jgi:hypothetical protein